MKITFVQGVETTKIENSPITLSIDSAVVAKVTDRKAIDKGIKEGTELVEVHGKGQGGLSTNRPQFVH